MSKADSWLGTVGVAFSAKLFQLAALALLTLLLYGVLPPGRIAWLLSLFVLSRGALLTREALRRPAPLRHWEDLYASRLSRYEQLGSEGLAEVARELEVDEGCTATGLASAEVEAYRRGHVPPRARSELACEGLGLIAFALLIPADALIYSRDFLSLRSSGGWQAGGVALLCAGLYAWPLLWPPSRERSRSRMLWWALPVVPALGLLVAGIAIRHPYLDPFREDRVRLAAERVLALENNIHAGAHADWVFDYAEELETEGQMEKAIRFYRKGLRLAPHNFNARNHVAALEFRIGNRDQSFEAVGAARERAHLPLLAELAGVVSIPRCQIDAGLTQLDQTTAVIARIGDVDDWLLDAIGDVIYRELGLPSCVVEDALPLPSHTRARGLVYGRQWSVRSLVEVFLSETRPPVWPVKYILVTPVDIYHESNYMFAGTYSWGAVVSFARFGDPRKERLLVANRTAKQALGSLLKSFNLPISPDSNCVTSYPNGLAQFDAKGNRPNDESLALFDRALRQRNRAWAKKRSPAP